MTDPFSQSPPRAQPARPARDASQAVPSQAAPLTPTRGPFWLRRLRRIFSWRIPLVYEGVPVAGDPFPDGVRGNGSSTRAPKLRGPGDLSPFLDARAIASSHFARLQQQKLQWMTAALLLGVALIICAAGLVYLSTSTRVTPFLVEVGAESGRLLSVGPIEPMGKVEDYVVRRHLATVVEGLRTVYNDRRATTERFREAFAYVEAGSEADVFIRDYLQREGENPLELVGRLQRSVDEVAVSPIAGTRSWDLQWVEREAPVRGQPVQRIFKGSFSVRRDVPSGDAEALLENPLGLFIEGAMWRVVSEEVIDLSAGGR